MAPPTKHRAFIVEVCTWMPRVIPFSTHSSVVTSTGHIAPWLRAQPEHTQHGHAQVDVDGLAAARRARAGGLAGLRVHVQV